MIDKPVALWFMRNMGMDYEILDDEKKAAKFAVEMEEYESGSPVGIQFPDGRIIWCLNWKAYKDAQDEYESARQNRISSSEKRSYRDILNPFDGAPMKIDADEPMWLGKAL